ncbi:hypothetical protein RQP46_008178 [Phenoliferia psychrophenolica]
MALRRHDVAARLGHRHYILNSLICTPLPLIVASHLRVLARTNGGLERNSVFVLVALPAFLALSVLNRRWDSIEALLESVFWILELVNAMGLFIVRTNITIPGWYGPAYLFLWFLVSLFAPQPGYQGPHKLLSLDSSAEFEEEIEMVAPSTALDDPNAEATVTELKDYKALRKASKVFYVVLFHADWSAKSRALEITLSRLSNEYSSPTLQFRVITPDAAPQTFYDLDLSTHTTSFDLPVLMLYYRGKVVGRLPKGSKEVSRDAGRKPKAEESDGEESEDEREVERKVAMERYRWTRTGDSIVESFQLRERSGLFPSDKRAT